jgi:hypothetical protein
LDLAGALELVEQLQQQLAASQKVQDTAVMFTCIMMDVAEANLAEKQAR